MNNLPIDFPKQLTFQPPILEPVYSLSLHPLKLDQRPLQTLDAEQEFQNCKFPAEDRESLKNAFRYICRLIFKEAHKYKSRIIQIGQENGLILQNELKFNSIFERAQQISGERYFRKYISGFADNEQRTICSYMRWFLETKYLRYINIEGKGKRKMMKKNLYIKFKNQIMLPYLQKFVEKNSQ